LVRADSAATHPYLHHYTTEAGLRGIVDSNSLWATYFADLNDSKEIHEVRVPLVQELTTADFRGQKIRIPGPAPLQTEPFKKLGVSPVSLPLGEALPAMQNKAIDGVIAAFTIFNAFKYYDVAKEITYLPGSFLVASGLVNRKFMASLGPELEAIVREEAQKHQDIFSKRGVEDLTRIRASWVSNGGKIVTLPPDEAKAYLETVTSVVPAIVDNDPQMKADYEALLNTAKKYRQQ
jgi:TRAP-type C4-dicarboxylate transport system substrate-binding protein